MLINKNNMQLSHIQLSNTNNKLNQFHQGEY